MLEMGWGYVRRAADDESQDLWIVGENARTKKIGIYDKCVQETNPANPKCNIKGNIGQQGEKTKLYRDPDCGQYGNTLIQLYLGDKWFCGEKEARAARFTKGSDCK